MPKRIIFLCFKLDSSKRNDVVDYSRCTHNNLANNMRGFAFRVVYGGCKHLNLNNISREVF